MTIKDWTPSVSEHYQASSSDGNTAIIVIPDLDTNMVGHPVMILNAAVQRSVGSFALAVGNSGSVTASDDVNDTLETEFRGLADRWYRETGGMSSVSQKAAHPAYQAIMAKGRSVIPLILRELRTTEPDDWFYALHFLTEGAMPIRSEHEGDALAMADDWLSWGRNRHYQIR